MNKKKLQIARNKIDQLDKKILFLIKKRTAVVKYMLSLKGFKNQIVDHKRIKEILKKIKKQSTCVMLSLFCETTSPDTAIFKPIDSCRPSEDVKSLK